MFTVCGDFLQWGKPQVIIVFNKFYIIPNWRNGLDDLETPGLGLAQDNLWSSVSWLFGTQGLHFGASTFVLKNCASSCMLKMIFKRFYIFDVVLISREQEWMNIMSKSHDWYLILSIQLVQQQYIQRICCMFSLYTFKALQSSKLKAWWARRISGHENQSGEPVRWFSMFMSCRRVTVCTVI